MKKINIAIEGTVASGKGTISWEVAKKLDYIYVDTGALYRGLTLVCLRNNCDIHDENSVYNAVKDINLQYHKSQDITKYKCRIVVNEEDVTPLLRTPAISSTVQYVASHPKIRPFVIAIQRKLAENKGVVMEGRGIVEEIMPDAELKIYMTADEKVRAHRRWEDLKKLGETLTEKEVLDMIRKRDTYDQTRAHGKLTIKPDALIVDTTNISANEAIELIYQKAQSKINST